MADAPSLAKHIQQIKAAIAPWRTSRHKPPFKSERLVAMALLLEGRPMSSKSIFMWINEAFPWYSRKVSEAFWNKECSYQHLYQCPRQQDSPSKSVLELENEIEMSLESYEFPAYTEEGSSTRWCIKEYDGIELLRPIMGMPSGMSTAKAGFFDLPAELRNTIYAMVVQYPTGSGLIVPKQVPRGSMTRFEMCYHHTEPRKGDVVRNKISTTTRPLTEILNPLLTCRQIYNEALPTFYRINHFQFEDLEHLRHRLTRLSPRRRKHLSHISVSYPRRDRVIAEDAFEFLLYLDHLRVLNLKIQETSWLKYARTKAEKEALKSGDDPVTAREQFQSALDMPGMSVLRSVRGLEEVNVTGLRKDTVLPRTVATLRKELMAAEKGIAKLRPMKRKYAEDKMVCLKHNIMEAKKAKQE